MGARMRMGRPLHPCAQRSEKPTNHIHASTQVAAMSIFDLEALFDGNRRALAKAITLVESKLESHREQAQEILEQILPHSGNSVRIGITGVPGVGKSTFIEAFGLYLISQGKRVAVLAVDPSSPIAGGSILGDKTPNGGVVTAGGGVYPAVARRRCAGRRGAKNA